MPQGQVRVRLAAAFIGLSLTLLSACGLPQKVGDDGRLLPAYSSDRRISESGGELHNQLVVGMLDQKQYYAALAHIQEIQNQSGNTTELRYLEADARRNLGQLGPAEALYRGLLKSTYAADAYHGLGLLYSKTDLKLAVQQLQAAVQRRPTDTGMRNDLGYALMMAGRYQEALPQLATAVELDPGGDKSLNNLIVLLLLTRDEAGAKRTASQAGISEKAFADLRKRAQELAQRRRR